MKFTKLEIKDPLSKVVGSSLPLYRKAPDNQKGGIRIQVSKRMEEMIKAQGKIYLAEEKAYAEGVKKTLADLKTAVGKSVDDMKALQKLKHKPKNEQEIKKLHLRIDQTHTMGIAHIANLNEWREGLTSHQGWRAEVIPSDSDAKELLGDDEIARLDALFKKIREVGVGAVASVSSAKKQAPEMLHRLETLSKAAEIAAKDMLGAQEVENFATTELDKLEKPNGELDTLEQRIHSTASSLKSNIKGVEDFLKDLKDKKKKVTAKDITGQQTVRNRDIQAKKGDIKLFKTLNDTAKAICGDIKSTAKKGGKNALSPDTIKRLSDALAKTKEYDKILKEIEKNYPKYEKLVTKELAKAKPTG